MANQVILDGDLLAQDTLNIKVTSLGLAYGFGVFETIKFCDRQPCFFREHVDRLETASLRAGLRHGYSKSQVAGFVQRLLDSSRSDSGIFKIIVFEDSDTARMLLFVRSAGSLSQSDGLRLCVSDIVKSSTAFTSRHKTTNYMENWLELQKAQQHGFDECLFFNEFGQVTECSMSNIFFMRNGILNTSHLDCGLLNGVVRSKLIDLCEEDGVIVNQGRFQGDDLVDCESAFVTNSGVGISSVSEISMGNVVSELEENASFLRRLRDRFAELERTSMEDWQDVT